MFVDDGHDATELSQCPHRPGTQAWKVWQRDFMDGQSRERRRFEHGGRDASIWATGMVDRARDAYQRADARIAAVKEQTVYTEKNAWHDEVMAEVEPRSKERILEDVTLHAFKNATFKLFRLDDNMQPTTTDPYWTGVGNITTTASGAGYTCGVTKSISGWSISGTLIFDDMWDTFAHRCTGDPVASPRQYRRTRGQTIEERRLAQALSGKPITVRPSPQNHQWKKKR